MISTGSIVTPVECLTGDTLSLSLRGSNYVVYLDKKGFFLAIVKKCKKTAKKGKLKGIQDVCQFVQNPQIRISPVMELSPSYD
jgi:hypothetical protein